MEVSGLQLDKNVPQKLIFTLLALWNKKQMVCLELKDFFFFCIFVMMN